MKFLLVLLTGLFVFACTSNKLPEIESSKELVKPEQELKESPCVDSSKIDMRPCTMDYNPVCGCNQKTYSNVCAAEANGVTSWSKGACQEISESCIDSSLIKAKPCTRDYRPVCGCNGQTYSNACVAESNGVKSYTSGKCK